MNATATHSGGHVVAADYRFLRENEAGDDVFGGTRLLSWRVVGPRMRPQLRGAVAREIDVPEFLTPPSVPQGGAGRRSLDTLDPRVWQATGVRHADSHRYRIWTSHTVAGARTQSDSPRRSAVRWYEFEPPGPSGDRPIQAGTVDSAQVEEAPADMNVFNGAISPDRTGRSAAIHYNISNATSAVRIHARSRRATDPLGAMVGSQVLLQSSTDANGGYVTLPPTCQNRSFVDGTTVCRWGDYAAATPDPTIDGVIWGTNMWISADGRYRTKNFALQPVAAP